MVEKCIKSSVCQEPISELVAGPDVIELFSCSTQLSMKFHLVIKIPTIKTFFMLSSAEHAQLS